MTAFKEMEQENVCLIDDERIDDTQDQDIIVAGYGSCRSCGCTGYIRDNSGSARCECKHSFSQHR